MRPRRAGTELLPAEIARLGRDEKLDRDDAPAERDLLGEPAGRERRHRRPVLDPLGLRGRDELERHGLGEQPGLCGERLHGDAELAEGALGEARVAPPRPSGSPVSGAWRSFTVRSARAREHLRDHQARKIESSRERGDLEVPDRDEALLVDDHERVRLVRVQLALDLLGDEVEGVAGGAVQLRQRPEAERILERARRDPLPATSARSRSIVAWSPGDGRADASAGWSSDSRFAPSASRSSAAATSSASRSARASWTASAAWPVENAFWFSSAMPSPGAGDCVAEEPDGEVGRLREVGLPDRAERADDGKLVVVQRLDDALGELGSCTGQPLCEGVREPNGRGADDVARKRRPLCDQVLAQEQRLVPVVRDAEGLADADPGRDAVRLHPVRQRALDDRAGRGHAIERPRGPAAPCSPSRATRTTSSIVSELP